MLPPQLDGAKNLIYAALDFHPRAAAYFRTHEEEFRSELSTMMIARADGNTELEGQAIRCIGYHLRERLRQG